MVVIDCSNRFEVVYSLEFCVHFSRILRLIQISGLDLGDASKSIFQTHNILIHKGGKFLPF